MTDITVDGRPVRLEPGQMLGVAVRERLFCAIGVCFACVVTVNGTPGLRACLTEARPGDEVTR